MSTPVVQFLEDVLAFKLSLDVAESLLAPLLCEDRVFSEFAEGFLAMLAWKMDSFGSLPTENGISDGSPAGGDSGNRLMFPFLVPIWCNVKV